ncbi:MAG: Uncharacterized protein JWQ11_4056 [Rhizobacter sp.]|nr:Uncharacterized protein [Rhizobacter sp.]
MAQERKTKAVVYKNAVFDTARAVTLKQALSLALARQPFIGDRRESLGPAGESPQWRLVGQYRAEADMLFGVLMTYMPGTASLFFVDDTAATSLTVEQFMAPSTDDGKRRERLDGTLFFAVLGNHCVLMQSASVRERHFEAHLHWLLGLQGDGDLPRLVDHLPRKSRQAVEARGVREVEIGGALWTPATQAPATSAEPDTSMLGALKALLAPDDAARLDLEALAGSNIEYTLKVRYRGSTSDRGQHLMNTLGAVFRDAEGIEARIHLVGGGTIDGADMRLAGNVRISTVDGVPDPEQVFEAMRAWLLEKVSAEEIAA